MEFNGIYTKEEAKEFVSNNRNELNSAVRDWIEEESELLYMPASTNEVEHILHCLKGMVAQLFGLYPAGGFGGAVLGNDLFSAVGRADDSNQRFLPIYTKFLYWHVPGNLLREQRVRYQEERSA